MYFLRSHSQATRKLMREKAKLRDPKQYQKTAEKLRGRKKTPTHVAKMAASKRGVPQQPHSIEQRAQKNRGQKRSNEQRLKMAESQKGLKMYANIASFEIKRFREDPKGDWLPWNNKWGLPSYIREKYPREMFLKPLSECQSRC